MKTKKKAKKVKSPSPLAKLRAEVRTLKARNDESWAAVEQAQRRAQAADSERQSVALSFVNQLEEKKRELAELKAGRSKEPERERARAVHLLDAVNSLAAYIRNGAPSRTDAGESLTDFLTN